MTTSTLTLAEFLLARIAEDEAVARAAVADGPRQVGYAGGQPVVKIDDGRWSVGDTSPLDVVGVGFKVYDEGGHTFEQAEHVARHDPARVLAECEAKRRIVERAAHIEPMHDHSGSFTIADLEYVEHILPALAAVYADHPDFDPAWA